MTDNQKAAYIMSQCISAYAEIEGMKAHNQHQLAIGETQLYAEEAFGAIPLKFGIDPNQVINFFNN